MYGSSITTQTLRQLMDVSRMWLGVDEARRIVRLPALDEAVVLQALQDGAIAECGHWTIKVTPPRRIPDPGEAGVWTPGIMAVSVHGFASGLRVDADSVRLLCGHIKAIERRRAARLDEELAAERDGQRAYDGD